MLILFIIYAVTQLSAMRLSNSGGLTHWNKLIQIVGIKETLNVYQTEKAQWIISSLSRKDLNQQEK